MKFSIMVASACLCLLNANAQTNEAQWLASYTNALSQRDERVGRAAALKGVEMGTHLTFMLLETNPSAYTNATDMAVDTVLFARRIIDKESFDAAMQGTRAVLLKTNVVSSINKTNDLIRFVQFVEDGTYCTVKGFHKWHYPPRVIISTDNSLYRECHICGKGETQQPGEWK